METKSVNPEYIENPIVNLAFMGIKDLQRAMKLNLKGEKEFLSLISCLPDAVYKEGEHPIINIVDEAEKFTKDEITKLKTKRYPQNMSTSHIQEDITIKSKNLYHQMYFEIIRAVVNRLDEVYHITEKSSHTKIQKV